MKCVFFTIFDQNLFGKMPIKIEQQKINFRFLKNAFQTLPETFADLPPKSLPFCRHYKKK